MWLCTERALVCCEVVALRLLFEGGSEEVICSVNSIYVKISIISSMNNSKSIFKSNKVIGLDLDQKKVKVQIVQQAQKVEEGEDKENKQSFDRWAPSTRRQEDDKDPLALKKGWSAKESSCKLIKSKSCLKKACSAEEDDIKSTKSIKFREQPQKVEYSLPELHIHKKSTSGKKQPLPLKEGQEIKLECCQIY